MRNLIGWWMLLLAFAAVGLVGCGSSNSGGSDSDTTAVDGDVVPDGDSDSEAVSEDGDSSSDHTLTIMTYNLMCSICGSTPGDDLDHEDWDARVPHFGDIIARHSPDVIGMQEYIFADEVTQVLAVAPGYSAIYTTFTSGSLDAYPDATIFYRTSRFTVEDSGHFWLSPTPDSETPSKGWTTKQTATRLVVWAKLKQNHDGREFYFMTTHFDNNQPNQPNSASLALTRIEPLAATYPVIFVGDFNSEPTTDAYGRLEHGTDGTGFHMTNAHDLVTTTSIDTNQTPVPAYDFNNCIDHVWLAGTGVTWASPSWTVDLTVYGAQKLYPSDHRPVISKLTF